MRRCRPTARLYGQVQRKLFADVAAGRSAVLLKNDYIREYGIPARMFNAVRVSLEGKVSAVRAAQRLRVDGLERRIAQAERQVAQAEEQGRWQQVHQKRRRLANLESRLAGLEADVAAGRVRLCFGSKRLWRKQHHLEQNGYASHEEWLQDWQDARSDEFFVLGSRDETAGCQLCVASIGDDGTLTLRLRLPDGLANQHGKYLVIEGVRFAYGHEQVLAGLQCNAEYAAYRREHGEKAARATALGQAISYRFKRDGKGWRVFVSTQMMDVPVVTDRRRGAIGVDLNADHLAVADTDASGQLPESLASTAGHLRQEHQPGRGPHRRRRGQRCAVRAGSWQTHRLLRSWTSGRRRLSWRASPAGTAGCCPASATARSRPTSFPAAAGREWEIHQVNPAYSSVIGRVKFMERYGLTVHQAAALVLGPSLARLFGAYPAPVGLSRRQWRSGRLHRTREEAREARVDVLGCDLGAAETGACSAASAGEAETRPQSGSGCRAG